MRRSYLFLLVVSLFVLVSCELAERDPLEPGLPQYTTTGRNSVGALINGVVWRDLNFIGWYGHQSSMTIQHDTVSNKSRIFFSANLVMEGGYTQGASVYFTFNDRLIKSKDDLIFLNNTEWSIDGNKVEAGVMSSYFDDLDCSENRGTSGTLYIRQAGLWEQDPETRYDVFSGTFGFTITSDCGELNVFRGRYDYGVHQIMFYPDVVD